MCVWEEGNAVCVGGKRGNTVYVCVCGRRVTLCVCGRRGNTVCVWEEG